MIYGISGRIGSGKDTLALEMIKHDPSFEIRKFAWKLKEICGVLCGVDPFRFEDQDFKKQQSPFDMTYRELLQKVGTEAIRQQIHQDAWVRALFSEYNKNRVLFGEDSHARLPGHLNTPLYPNWIITDVRFPNEADAVKERGGKMIRVYRNVSGPAVKDLHPSETALDDYDKFDFTINNNGTLEELSQKAKIIMV